MQNLIIFLIVWRYIICCWLIFWKPERYVHGYQFYVKLMAFAHSPFKISIKDKVELSSKMLSQWSNWISHTLLIRFGHLLARLRPFQTHWLRHRIRSMLVPSSWWKINGSYYFGDT